MSDRRSPDGGRTSPADLDRDRSAGETERLGGSRRNPRAAFDLEELRRRNPSTLAIDVLYLFASAFFATLALRGFWPLIIAAVPLGTLLYFAWRSSPAFLAGQAVAIAASIAATEAGLLPL